ncbi:MAG: type II toxin-antitoxin system HicB family antitoxin [Deltaproteobacteria bacterium]|jgi:predicted RNase H-like HicB family nuclease
MERYGITMNVKLPVEILKRERWYVASCPALDVASQGETIKKAKDNLSEAVSLFLISCLERGTLEQVLRACGFTASQLTKRKQHIGYHKRKYINVPLELLPNIGGYHNCHV